MRAFIVAGLGFGDEGKGTIVDYLTKKHKAKLVVRYNGGPQAGHTVVTDDRKSHTFAQFGSGTLQGADTYLSQHMLISPTNLLVEARGLGISNIHEKIWINENAPLVTPFHVLTNRAKELFRKAKAGQLHGSCGLGVGEARKDILKYGQDICPTAKDMSNTKKLKAKLDAIKHIKFVENEEEIDWLREYINTGALPGGEYLKKIIDGPVSLPDFIEACTAIASRVVSDTKLIERAKTDEVIIFEGAQGALLDEVYGFYPFNTWTNTTFENARTLCTDADIHKTEIENIGVIRTYLTRHGAGPFPTEGPWNITDENNPTNQWQNNFRVGPLDQILLKYCAKFMPCDSIALTHVDGHEKIPYICSYYVNSKPTDLYVGMGDRTDPNPPKIVHNTDSLIESKGVLIPANLTIIRASLTEIFKAPIKIESYGPKTSDKVDK